MADDESYGHAEEASTPSDRGYQDDSNNVNGDGNGQEQNTRGATKDLPVPLIDGGVSRTKFYRYDNGEGHISLKFVNPPNKKPARPSDRVYPMNSASTDNGNGPVGTASSSVTPKELGKVELKFHKDLCELLEQGIEVEWVKELAEALEHEFPSEKYEPTASPPGTQDNTAQDPARKDNGPNKDAGHSQLDDSQAPLAEIHGIFDHLTEHACEKGLVEACKPFEASGLRVMTMCSGTEAPFVAMNLVQQSLASRQTPYDLKYDHVGSAEIEPWKQAFIERNFCPPKIFRDVLDFIPHALDPNNSNLWPVTAYGARIKPDEDVHLLVAGSSCVDYSGLNKDKANKGEQGQGESAQTLKGILAYAKQYSPTLVILENVLNAPWGLVRKTWSDAGYECVSLKVDSINYYLPQTRGRGYLLGINRAAAAKVDFDIEAALKQWVIEMSDFQRRASSPYPDFALSDEDPRLLVAKNQSEEISGKTASIKWEKCRLRHVKIRADQALGNRHPYTNRGENPRPMLADHGWQNWISRESKRVQDYLDVHHLSAASQRDFDTKHKHRNINVSQNLDRDPDFRQWGIVGAITPHGTLADTRRAGPITGLEVFALQGFPIGDLNLGQNTSRQLQNLAGNAMTTTVIAAAILSAILACKVGSKGKMNNILKPLRTNYSATNLCESVAKPKFSGEKVEDKLDPLPDPFDESEFPRPGSDSSVIRFSKEAAELQPLCRCEGLDRRSEHEIVYCPECYYTCCRNCSRERHGLERLEEHLTLPQSVGRPVARDFTTSLIKALPPVLCLDWNHTLDFGALFKNSHFDAARDEISAVFKCDLHFRGISFEGCWRVLYESEYCRLELDFASKRNVCDTRATDTDSDELSLSTNVDPMWLLFAKVPETAAVNDKARTALRHHIARMRPSGTLLNGDWELWDGPQKSFAVHITGQGTQIPAWEQKLGLQSPPFKTLMAFSELEVAAAAKEPLATSTKTLTSPDETATAVTKVEEAEMTKQMASSLDKLFGKYKLLQDCPAPSSTLHRKSDSSSGADAPIFMFLMSNPLDDAILDRVVFSTQAQPRDLRDDRTIIAKLEAPWRPIVRTQLSKGMKVECDLMDQYSPCGGLALKAPKDKNIIRTWHQNPVPDPATDLTTNLSQPESCANSTRLFLVDLNKDSKAVKMLSARRDPRIVLEQKPDALKEFGWILSYATDLPHLEHGWQNINHLVGGLCTRCCPPPPQLRWVAKRAGDSKEKVQAIESSIDAARYENALKRRPDPAVALLYHSPQGPILEIRVNIPSLAHRAVASLSATAVNSQRIMSLEWRLVKYYAYAPVPRLGPVTIESNEGDKINDEEPDKIPGEKTIGNKLSANLKRKLWDSQLRVLQWMSGQERKPPTWEELSLVEACLPALGWSLETRALLPSPQIRGGIIADEVGAGKTTTSLALVSFDYHQRLTKAAEVETEPPLQGKLNSNATLILVPKNLQKQWEDELKACLEWRRHTPGHPSRTQPYYIAAGSTIELQKFSVDEIQNATIILSAWDLFNDDAYWKYLKKIACTPGLPDDASRAFEEWLTEALEKLDRCLKGQSAPENLAKQFWEQWKELRKSPKQFERYEGYLTRATHKAEFAAQKKAAKASKDADQEDPKSGLTPEECLQKARKAVESELDEFEKKDTIPVLLHMFRFRRLVVDEFSYLPGKSLLGLIQLQATRRWLLSGTPPIHSYDDVNTMAKLLQTRVASYDEHEGKYDFGSDARRMSDDKSETQQFLSQNQIASAGYTEQVYAHARLFLGKFARKNAPSADRKKKESQQCSVSPTPCELITYFDAMPLAIDPNRIFGKAKPSDGAGDDPNTLSSIDKLADLVEQAEGPEAALITSSLMLTKIWDIEKDPGPVADVQASLGEFEWTRLQEMLQEQGAFVLSRTSQLYNALKLLWGLEFSRGDDAVAVADAVSFQTFIRAVENKTLLDTAASAVVGPLLWSGQDDPSMPVGAPGKNAFNEKVAEVQGHIEVLMRSLRRMRFLNVVRQVQHGGPLPEKCQGCDEALVEASASVSTRCGDILCRQCVVTSRPCCASFGDAAELKLFRTNVVSVPFPSLSSSASVTCPRMRTALALVKAAVNNGEKVLAFAQFKGMKDLFVAACQAAGVACYDGFGDDGAGGRQALASRVVRAIGGFQSAKSGVVLVLKVDSADAAGWNLQEASHVLFLGPVVATSREKRCAAMEQAVGRCWRPGQLKEVVYVHLLSVTGTVESRMAREWLWEEVREARGV